MLAIESHDVIRLRMAKLMGGGIDAQDEAALMVSEKIAAMVEAGFTLATGGTLNHVVDRYREQVVANSDRLLA